MQALPVSRPIVLVTRKVGIQSFSKQLEPCVLEKHRHGSGDGKPTASYQSQ